MGVGRSTRAQEDAQRRRARATIVTCAALAAVTLLLAACGGRSVSLPPWVGDGGPSYDGASTDGVAADGPGLDGRQPLDRRVHDACLPIPASQVKGNYSGSWKGTWKCHSSPAQTVSGTLYFTLSPAGAPESFDVVGAMSGYVQSGIPSPLSSNIKGTMGCTALNASLPYIQVGSGAVMLTLTGTMRGTFSTQGFRNGTWTAKETKSQPCQASGTWQAKK
jgi:hypothetical protein